MFEIKNYKYFFMKKIIFLTLISLLVTGSVWAFVPRITPAPTPPTPTPTPVSAPASAPVLAPMPLPVSIERIEEEKERIKEVITEVQRIDREIEKEISEKAREIKEITGVSEERIKGLIEKTKEVKEFEREIEEKRGVVKRAEERVVVLEKEIVDIEGIKPRAIERVIKDAGIDIALVGPEKIEEGIRSFGKDKQKALNETREKRDEVKKEIEEIVQKRERVREERQRQVEEIGVQAVPLVEDTERIIAEKRTEQLAKIVEIRRDSDGDGLSDEQEISIRTNPFNPDTDGDGFLDGIEVARGFNPLSPRTEVEVIIQDPRGVTPQKIDVYIVENVKVITLPDQRRGIEISGRGLPNSLITLFIFSEPIIVTVKTDRDGRWSYILEDPQDGKHEVFVAITNNRGNIEARSLVFPFVLAGENVAVIPYIAKVAALPVEELLQRDYLIAVLIVVVLGIIAGLFIIKTSAKKKEEKVNI